MSIILDALKKAEGAQAQASQESAPVQGNASGTFFVPPATGESKLKHVTPPRVPQNQKMRTMILLIVAVLVVGGVVYMKVWRGPAKQEQKFEPISLNEMPAASDQPVANATQTSATQDKIKELQGIATSKFSEGKYDESVSAYEKLTHLLPSDPFIYNNYGVALKKIGQIDAAQEAYQTALALNPDYAEALNNFAVTEMTKRRYNEARNALERAVELKPDYVDPYLHLALCLERLGETARAITFYEKFLELSQVDVDRSIRLQVEQRLEELKE